MCVCVTDPRNKTVFNQQQPINDLASKKLNMKYYTSISLYIYICKYIYIYLYPLKYIYIDINIIDIYTYRYQDIYYLDIYIYTYMLL